MTATQELQEYHRLMSEVRDCACDRGHCRSCVKKRASAREIARKHWKEFGWSPWDNRKFV